jgi:formylglycine-generating enzyme required for sulfatase activity/tRNA A-37 threonylcarbamoyl transferase component Bud32
MPLLNLENVVINNRYDVRCRMARGSFAEIYEAVDVEQGCTVIIKALNTRLRGGPEAEIEEKLVSNFKQEAALLETLRHANIVQSFGQGAAKDRDGNDFLFLTLEHLSGGNLHDYCRQWPLTLAETMRYFQPLCEALSVIHARGVVHRDIKPGNLVFDANRDRLKITDFGVARMLNSGNARESTRVGTDLYSPPEHHPNLDGRQEMLTPAADIYSLAKAIYTAMTGRLPNEFRRKPIDRLPPELAMEPWGERLLAVLRRATAHKVGERYASADGFWRDFASIAEADKSAASPEPDDATHPQIKLPFVIATLIGALGLTLVLQAAFAGLLPEPAGSLIAVLAGAGISVSAAILLMRRRSATIAAAQPVHSSLQSFTFDALIVDATGRIRQSRKGSARQFVEPLGEEIALEMVEVPDGKFRMGSPNSEAGHTEHEEPQHSVRVASFFLGKFPVTQAQWRVVAGWPKVNLELNLDPSSFTGDDLPVENISWRDAIEFCERLSRRTGRRYRLPSEAEWEYACRAGSQTPFHFGETIVPGLANYDYSIPYGRGPSGAGREQTSPAGGFGVANDFGLFDMHGNVWEWLADVWHHDYRGAPADGSAWLTDGDQGLQVVRGGAWFNAARLCRSAYRYWAPADTRGHNCGFRVAMTMEAGS